MNLRSRDIAHIVNGQHFGADVVVHAVNTDSRQATAQSLFIAIKGERFDAHDFVAQASSNGALVALVQRAVDADITQIVVTDTRVAMAKLARHYRLMQPAFVVGLTGSCGKTTVKEMLASIFRHVAPTHATQGNLNNDLGVPLTLFKLQVHHRYAVIEMGANHLGEIAYCAEMAKPQVSLVTMVAPAHLEGFGSIDGVATAKSEIYRALPVDGIAVINADDHYADFFREAAGGRQRITFGISNKADVSATAIRFDDDGFAQFHLNSPRGNVDIKLSLPGQHNVMNALAAAATAIASGVELAAIATGLQHAPHIAGRLTVLRSNTGARVIDDSYNANLASMTAAFDFLAQSNDRKVAVLGHMGELGADAAALHHELGVRAKQRGIQQLLLVGELSRHTAIGFGDGAQWFATLDELITTLKTIIDANTSVLVKGSRSARMESVVQALVPAATFSGGAH